MTPDHSFDVAIVGGGLNGPALALALARAGLRVCVIDAVARAARVGAGFDGRGYALALTSQRLLAAIGVWGEVAHHSQPILDVKVSEGQAGRGPLPFVLEFDHAETGEGPLGYMLEDRHLRPALITALEGTGIVQFDGVTVADQTPDETGIDMVLSDGLRLRAALVVGCDGRRSDTCTRAGIKRQGWDYGQTALVCAIAHERPHNGIAHQFFMPAGPLAILPLPGNQSSIVWTETHARAAQIADMDDAEYLDALRPAFGSFLGDISLVGGRFSYPLSLSLAENFVADRVALVGDAAHGMHPIAGQGLNAGFKDVAALAEVLVEARRRGEDIGRADVLARYQTWRRFDTMVMMAATDGFNRLFSNDNPFLRATRNLGMGLVNAFPGLRRSFSHEAAGLGGDLPRLLTGKPL